MLSIRSVRFLTTLMVVPVMVVALGACRVEKTQEGRMPDVDVEGGQIPKYDVDVKKTQEGEMPDVDVKGGQLPKYDVDPAQVEIETQPKTVTVPDVDVDVNKKEVTIPVPDVDIVAPEKDDVKPADKPQANPNDTAE